MRVRRCISMIVVINLVLLINFCNGQKVVNSVSDNDGNITKNELILTKKATTSWWKFSKLWDWIKEETSTIGSSRTFGHIRRMQMALIPIIFKFGVMSAMITVLVFLAMKTILLLKALLILNGAGLLAKLLSFKLSDQHQPPVVYNWAPNPGWQQNPPWGQQSLQGKEIHLHIHNDGGGGALKSNYNNKGWESEPYGAYSTTNDNYIGTSQDMKNIPVSFRRYGISNTYTK